MLPASPESFRAWLESHPPQAVIVDAKAGAHPAQNDPLCAYLRWRGATDPWVGMGRHGASLSELSVPTPEWASRFTGAYDRAYSGAFAAERAFQVTAGECLQLLESIA